MSDTKLINIIESAFDNRSAITAQSVDPSVKDAINEVIAGLDDGSLRVANKIDGQWVVNQWVKKAVLLIIQSAAPRGKQKLSRVRLRKNPPYATGGFCVPVCQMRSLTLAFLPTRLRR